MRSCGMRLQTLVDTALVNAPKVPAPEVTEEVIEFVAEVIDTEALDALRRAEEEMAAKAMGATAVVESPFDAAEKWTLVSP